jgi:hypothetical protein
MMLGSVFVKISQIFSHSSSGMLRHHTVHTSLLFSLEYKRFVNLFHRCIIFIFLILRLQENKTEKKLQISDHQMISKGRYLLISFVLTL